MALISGRRIRPFLQYQTLMIVVTQARNIECQWPSLVTLRFLVVQYTKRIPKSSLIINLASSESSTKAVVSMYLYSITARVATLTMAITAQINELFSTLFIKNDNLPDLNII